MIVNMIIFHCINHEILKNKENLFSYCDVCHTGTFNMRA